MSLDSRGNWRSGLGHPTPAAAGPFAGGVGTTVYQKADQSVTSSVTAIDSTNLTANVEANAVYDFELWVPFSLAGTASGYKFSLDAPVTPTNLLFDLRLFDGVTPALVRELFRTSFGGISGALAVIGTHLLTIKGMIETSDAGHINLRFAQNTSDSSAITLKRGAFLKLARIS